jgi:hypothetical protein
LGLLQVLQIHEGQIPLAAGDWRIRDATEAWVCMVSCMESSVVGPFWASCIIKLPAVRLTILLLKGMSRVRSRLLQRKAEQSMQQLFGPPVSTIELWDPKMLVSCLP